MIIGGWLLMRLNFPRMNGNLSQFKFPRWCVGHRSCLFFVQFVFAAMTDFARTTTTAVTISSCLPQSRLVLFCRFSPPSKSHLYVFVEYCVLKRCSHLTQYTRTRSLIYIRLSKIFEANYKFIYISFNITHLCDNCVQWQRTVAADELDKCSENGYI